VDLCLYLGADASPSVGGSCSCTETGVCSPPDLGVYAADVDACAIGPSYWCQREADGSLPKIAECNVSSSQPQRAAPALSNRMLAVADVSAGFQPDVLAASSQTCGSATWSWKGMAQNAVPCLLVPLLLQLTSVTNIGTCGYSNGICPS